VTGHQLAVVVLVNTACALALLYSSVIGHILLIRRVDRAINRIGRPKLDA